VTVTVTNYKEAVRLKWNDMLIALFVENAYLYMLGCHQRSDRSFFVRSRQFHVCARCTGLISGLIASPLGLLAPRFAFGGFLLAIVLLVLDGYTQLRGWRMSTNRIRLTTGFLVSAMALGALYKIAKGL